MDTVTLSDQWTVADSVSLHGLDRWGQQYFGANDEGEVVVNMPTETGVTPLSLMKVVEGLRDRGLEMPLMLRLENLLAERIRALNETFADAIAEAGYQAPYRGVFPIKVNQQSWVVAEIARLGRPFSYGLEAGSKAELLVAMASLAGTDGTIVCNGYKDSEFIDLGLQARKLGMNCFFVVETLKEIPLIVERSRHWNIQPLIGVRLKLTTEVDGHWSDDSGDRSLFGLTSSQLMQLVDNLRGEGMLDCLRLLHFHIGSQIPTISCIRDGVREACRYYTELLAEGAPLGYLDLGGGLAVDYDGTGGGSGHSCNYSLEEYAHTIVMTVKEALDEQGASHPILISESGRATVAPMSVLLFNVLHVADFQPDDTEVDTDELTGSVAHLADILAGVSVDNLQSSFNDALYSRAELRTAFRYGDVSLRQRAVGENLCLAVLQRVAALVETLEGPPPAGLESLRELLARIYYGNFSVFQSLPDSWAIGQVFPVMPIHRLDEMPEHHAVIADLTCDCDGKIKRFVGADGESSTLRLHALNEGEDYVLGAFLVGAYQETLGDLHNLFGDTNVASVRVDGAGRLEFVHELAGDSVADVLSYVEYHPESLLQKFRSAAETAVQDGVVSVAERQDMLRLFSETLRGYTYLEK